MKRPPRFTIAACAVEVDAGLARVAGAELHHMRDVMRLRAGAEVTLLDDRGLEFTGRIQRFEPSHALIEISVPGRRRSRPRIILAAAIIKGPRMDFMVEKAAELGAAELWPLVPARAAVKSPGAERLARWHRLAVAAAKQSLGPDVMAIRPALSIGELARNVTKEMLAVMCTAKGDPLAALIRSAAPCSILIVVGPEGDFEDDEKAMLAGAACVPASLGPNRLRSETAALAALSVAASELAQSDGRD